MFPYPNPVALPPEYKSITYTASDIWTAPAGVRSVDLVGQGAIGVNDFISPVYLFGFNYVTGGSFASAYDSKTFNQIAAYLNSMITLDAGTGTDIRSVHLVVETFVQRNRYTFAASPSSSSLPAGETLADSAYTDVLAYLAGYTIAPGTQQTVIVGTETLIAHEGLWESTPVGGWNGTGNMTFGNMPDYPTPYGYGWWGLDPGPNRSSGPLAGQPTNGLYRYGNPGSAATGFGKTFPGGSYTGPPTTVTNPGIALPPPAPVSFKKVPVVRGQAYPIGVPTGGFLTVSWWQYP